MNAVNRRIKEAHAAAEFAFTNHEISCRLYDGMFRNWRCKSPHTHAYSFTVTTIPGRLFVNGDVGDLMLEREEDMLRWAQQAVFSIDYFAEKSRHPVREYDENMAREWLRTQLIEGGRQGLSPSSIHKLEMCYEADDNADEYAFKKYLIDEELCEACEPPTCHNYTYSFLWCREAIMWLLSHMSAPAEYQYHSTRHVIQAVQWKVGLKASQLPPWWHDYVQNASIIQSGDYLYTGAPQTPLQLRNIVKPGDWVMFSPVGVCGSLPDHAFKQTYTPAPYLKEDPCTSASPIVPAE
jgi:hypothetical protein